MYIPTPNITNVPTIPIINFCLNYGGQSEIIDAIKKLKKENIDIDNLDIETFNHYMYQDLPPIDLLIRTSGEQRISNFMLWQISYAEFYFPKVYFPDFTPECLKEAINVYKTRDRRFGKIKK